MVDDTPQDGLRYAAAPFAPNSYARLRLIRQMHACGLLSGAGAVAAGEIEKTAPACHELADGSPRASC